MKTTVIHSKEGMLIQNENNTEINVKGPTNLSGFNPIELLTGSLGLCVSMSIAQLLERDEIKFEADQLRVSVSAEKAENRPSRVEQFTVEVVLPPHLDNTYSEKILRSAERMCTIGNTLKNGATIHLKERKAGN